MMYKILLMIGAGLVFLVLLLTWNTVNFTSRQFAVAEQDGVAIDRDKSVQRLAEAVKLQSLSHQQAEAFNPEPFVQLLSLIHHSFPRVAETLERDVIHQYSLLYRWQGSNPALKPAIFLAHLDVVPPEPETITQWQYPPFSGVIAEGYIWGRGTLDDKSSVFAMLEAVEHLLSQSYIPERTLYLAFGHDEEVGGKQGAESIARLLKQRNVQAAFTLDEGMVILDKSLSPAQKMTGIIGIAEKGYVSLKLEARAPGGHSSMPSADSATVRLSKAVLALQEHQFSATLAGVSGQMFDFLGPEMGGMKKVLFANRWLFSGPIKKILLQKNSTAAMVRTSTAVTMLSAGVKENVLPAYAQAVVNFRILPGDISQDVLQHARDVIDDSSVTVSFMDQGMRIEPSSISSTQAADFLRIGKTIQQVFPGAIFAPGLVLAATDSRHYQDIADNNYRFAPYTFSAQDLGRIHGINERIGVEDYKKMIQFYVQLVLNLNTRD